MRASPAYEALVAGSGAAVRLPLGAAAWVGELLRGDLGKPVLAIAPREADAMAWLEAAALFGEAEGPRPVGFPAPSLTPYQDAATSLPVRAQEAVALDAILSGRAGTVVATPRALFRKLPTAETFQRGILEIETDREHPLEAVAEHLTHWGYLRTDLVAEVGDFAVRGGVLDLFPPGQDLPVRLDLFGDTVESIRRFDPTSQRSEDSLERLRVLPLSLFPSGELEALEMANRLEEALGSKASLLGAERLDELRQQGRFAGWEHYLPWLHGEATLLSDLLDGAFLIGIDPQALEQEVVQHGERLTHDFEARSSDGRLALAPEELEHPPETVFALLDRIDLRVEDLVRPTPGAVDFEGSLTDLLQGLLPRFPRELETAKARGERCIVIASPSHRDRLEDLLDGLGLPIGPDGVEILPGDLTRGFRLPAAGVALYGEQQILPRQAPLRKRNKNLLAPFVSGLRDLRVGDYVVHTDHGIGQYTGLRSVGGDQGARDRLPPELREAVPESNPVEVMEITYASGKSLLVPLDRVDLVQKYSGIEGMAPRLDRLGGTSWNKTKSRVKKGLRDMAGELLKLYAERQLARAPALPPDSDFQHQFEAAFAYEETADQLDAIAAIKEDLERERPMDRLLCGDVGYGKTEVAMRAAFKTVDGGCQVAVLAPTTILADQHLETFRRRFEGFPVTVEMISRFRTAAEVKDIRKRASEGKVDVLIGTHRLLSKDIDLPKLGLLIVDEEQRFGVAQKERLKQLKKNLHVLALSATPVPRTLQLSLAGVRDMSVIETPPKDRMAVETAILPFDAALIREAIEFELARGGQVYYVYNRVESIDAMLTSLKEIVPGVRITVGHGQLEEQELARRMHAFTAGEHDVLLATTIIENGIDIPNVNTIFIHRAERFGLSQLYQLRGRVGRSDQLAYCYLLVAGDRVLTEQARKRLSAIREFTDLGAGFRIAARDLEIRGAGNLLGSQQSGHIAAVGIETYLKMLEDTVRELRGEKLPEDGPSAAIDLPVPMSIPASYIADANLRMEIYRRAAGGEVDERDLLAELADRFGPPPAEVAKLLEVANLKRLAERLRVQSISCRKDELIIRLRQDARINVDRLIDLVSSQPGAQFSPTGVLTLPAQGGDAMLRVAAETLREVSALPDGEDAGGQMPPDPSLSGTGAPVH